MAKTDWEEWIKANILEIIILVLVLVLVFNTLGTTTEEEAVVAEEAEEQAEEVAEIAPAQPEVVSEEGVGVPAEEPVPEAKALE